MMNTVLDWLVRILLAPLFLTRQPGGQNWLQRRRVSRAARKARSLAVDSIHDLLFVVDTHARIVDLNRAAAQACGVAFVDGRFGVEHLPSEWGELLRRFGGTSGIQEEVRVGERFFELTVAQLDEAEQAIGRMYLLHEVTEQKQAEEKLKQLSRAVEQSPATIVITDTRGTMEYVNPKFTELTGYSYEEALGNNPRILRSNLNPPELYAQMWESLLAGREWRGEFINRKKNGELYFESAIISPIVDSTGKVTHYLAVKEDISERKRAEEQLRELNETLQKKLAEIEALQAGLREQAVRDPLTGLYNRHYLNDTLERELLLAIREDYPVGFVMIDLDRFKEINDQYGHIAGDTILQRLAEQMQKNTRASDIVCRYGGDEFLVVLFNTGLEGARQYAERLCQAFKQIRFEFGDEKYSASLSIGVAAYPRDGGSGQKVLAVADEALYQAKREGRNRVVVWGEPVE